MKYLILILLAASSAHAENMLWLPNIKAYVTGTNLGVSSHAMDVNVLSLPPGGSIVTANQGTPNTIANAWPVKVCDGVDCVAITAAGEAQVISVAGTSIDAKTPTLGQKTMSGSSPVVIASDQSTLPVTVSGTIPLPTGAATAANQVLGNASLTSIDSKLNTLGQKTSAGSVPVVLASDQSSIIVTPGVASAGTGTSGAVTTVQTLTAPANATGFILMNLDTSTTNIRWAIGRVAAVGVGQQLQPGRDTGFVPCKGNVSIISETGSNSFDIQWFIL